jgi:hypothetical protein
MPTRKQIYDNINPVVDLLVRARAIGAAFIGNPEDETILYEGDPDLPYVLTAAQKETWLLTFDELIAQVKQKTSLL